MTHPKLPTPKHSKRTAPYATITIQDIARCTPRMLGPYAYIKIRTQLGGERIITVDEITQAIGWARNTVQRAVDDLIVEGLVRRSPGPGGRLRRLYAVDPETLPSILPLDGPDLADPDPDPDPEPLNYNPDSLLEDL